MSHPSTPANVDVLIVGAGVIGLGIAWRCQQRGLSVTLVDPSPGSGASPTAAGMLAPVTELHYGEEDLLALGIDETPLTFESDSVWSYEAGVKLGLLGGRAQVNSSVFYIDWQNPQLQNRLRCGQNYTVNAGHAVSKGADAPRTSAGAIRTPSRAEPRPG